MPKKDKKNSEPAPSEAVTAVAPEAPQTETLSPAELAKRHLEEALKRKRQAQGGQSGHGTGLDKGNVPHHQGGPVAGRNFRHQGR
jgi:hypothetical protein